MAFPNTSVTDIIATTIENRSGKLADNTTQNTALLAWLKRRGNVRTFGGGRIIYEELLYGSNGNGGWYSGYDVLPTSPADQISAAEFALKQYAVPVVASGLELLQNDGKEAIIDLIEGRIKGAEATMVNDISAGVYSDGTGALGKQIVGLDAAVPADPTTGTYGGINRATAANAFWRSQITTTTITAANVQSLMNTMYAKCTRNSDMPDLISMGQTAWGLWMASVQPLQRFTNSESATLGFPTTRFMHADVVMDGGIGGDATATNMYFLNTKYFHYRPHKNRNMVPLSPNKRYATNQDAEVQILAWAGALTCSGAQFQGRITGA